MIKVRFESATGKLQEFTTASEQSAMRAAKNNEVPGILANCGGNMGCGTCHVWVDEEFYFRLPEPSDGELAKLEEVAAERKSNSRLSCQIVLTEELDGIRFVVPEKQE